MNGLSKQEYQKLAVATVFAVAMGYLESAVVVYLRFLYYPRGFNFPLNPLMDGKVMAVEGVRELSTLVMLLGVAYLAGSNWKNRFAYFLLTFAVWDIFYYVGLKAVLDWPDSFRTFDILFLVPWPWVSPVLAPVVASLAMIALALCLLRAKDSPHSTEWALWIAGSFAILVSFLEDYGRLMAQGGYFKNFLNLATNPGFMVLLSNHVPESYDWFLFWVGEAVIAVGIYVYGRK
ncbi:MAG TPA: hypothetical protein VJ873_03715 [bacterium]|nr:hypothetical protein [bacterium]